MTRDDVARFITEDVNDTWLAMAESVTGRHLLCEEDEDYWEKRMAEFQRAAGGEKGAITGQGPQDVTYHGGRHTGGGGRGAGVGGGIGGGTGRPGLTPSGAGRNLSDDEVKRLGLHKNHQLVHIGSTADAPAHLPYVYIQARNKFMTNPQYRG